MESAVALAQEQGFGCFTADQLADRAGVSRRTIFNHFPSAESAVYTRLSELLQVVIDNFVCVAEESPSTRGNDVADVFDQLVGVVHRTELLPQLAIISWVLGSSGRSRVAAAWEREILRTVTDRLIDEIESRSCISRFDALLLSSSLVNAVGVAFELWIEQTGGEDTPENRLWRDELLTASFDRLRRGYSSA